MRHAGSLVVVLVATASLGACANPSEGGGGAEGPPRPRLAAASSASPTSSGDAEAPHQNLASPGLSTSGDTAPPLRGAGPCAEGMVLVDGDYCTEVREECDAWEDPPSNKLARCARFAPSVCAGERIHKRFCVDRDEYVPPGESLPLGGASWTQARTICEGQHKRLCLETEWEFACEGEQMLPYPTGYDRDPVACNFDKTDLVDPSSGKLRDQREPAWKVDRCASPFGVRSMAGNVDEWVWRDRTWGEWRSALKGGWWMGGRDRCRPATTAHGEGYRELQTGVRCCGDAADSRDSAMGGLHRRDVVREDPPEHRRRVDELDPHRASPARLAKPAHGTAHSDHLAGRRAGETKLDVSPEG